MLGRRFVAVPNALALIGGTWFGLQAVWCPVPLTVALVGCGIAQHGAWGLRTVALGTGLAVARLQADQAASPDPDKPVAAGLRVIGEWEIGPMGWSAPAKAEWLRAGLQIGLWNEKLWIAMPPTVTPPASRRLRVRGFLRRAPPSANGHRSLPPAWNLRIKSPRLVRELPTGPGQDLGMLWGVGERFRSRIESARDSEAMQDAYWSRILVEVLLLGKADALPESVKRGLRAAGLAHVVALSGLHVGLLAGLIMLATAGAPATIRFSLVALLVVGYVSLAGARPSLVRASIMLLALIASWLFRRPPQPGNTLGWVAGGMVLVEPLLLREPGFLLTVSATGGILGMAPALQRRWTRMPLPLARALSVSVGANLGALPWSLSWFHLASPLSPLWNLLAIPWAGVSLALVFTWAGLSLVAPPLAGWVASMLEVAGSLLGGIGELPPSLFLTVPVTLDWSQSCLLASFLAAVLLARRFMQLLAIVGLVALAVTWRPPSPADPELVVIDVGQGDAILIRDGQDTLMVDGGGWSKSDIAQKVLVPALGRLGVRRIGAVVLTHPDIDHCRGLLGLASYLPIGRLYLGMGWTQDRCVRELVTRAGLLAAPLWKGEELRVGRWKIRVLHPRAGDRRGRNNRSLVLLAETSNRRVLLTGDLEVDGELEILSGRGLETGMTIDVLKVGHHGSETSTSSELLAATRPRLAVISCGIGNRYGHPSQVVVDRLIAGRSRLLRTDLQGAVRILAPASGPIHVQLPGLPKRHWP